MTFNALIEVGDRVYCPAPGQEGLVGTVVKVNPFDSLSLWPVLAGTADIVWDGGPRDWSFGWKIAHLLRVPPLIQLAEQAE